MANEVDTICNEIREAYRMREFFQSNYRAEMNYNTDLVRENMQLKRRCSRLEWIAYALGMIIFAGFLTWLTP